MTTQTIIGSLSAFALAFSVASSAFATDIFYHHLDLDVDYVSSNLTLDIRTYNNMSAGVTWNADDYSPTNRINIPQSNSLVIPTPIGTWGCVAPSGTTIYRILEQPSDALKNYMGLNSTDLVNSVSGVTFANNKVTLTMSVVSKPAGSEFVVYSPNFSGTPGTYYFNTTAGACNKTAVDLNTSVGQHTHPVWAATAVGVYEMNFRVQGTVGGVAKDSGNVKYTFFVQ
jgi:surface-anchored protein